jgi:hypothetical protein
MSLVCGSRMEHGKARLDTVAGGREGGAKRGETARRCVPSRDALADRPVVVMKPL